MRYPVWFRFTTQAPVSVVVTVGQQRSLCVCWPRLQRVPLTLTDATTWLHSPQQHRRLGGLYALEQLAQDSDAAYCQVMSLLTAFVRAESPYCPPSERCGLSPEPLRTDIQAVMTVLGRRQSCRSDSAWETQSLDLSHTNLCQLYAPAANFTGMNLTGAYLAGANLYGAHLEGANLEGTHLKAAYLAFAHLANARFGQADLEGASLFAADLSDTRFCGANLSQVKALTQAQLNAAVLDEYTRLPDTLLPTLTAPPPHVPGTSCVGKLPAATRSLGLE